MRLSSRIECYYLVYYTIMMNGCSHNFALLQMYSLETNRLQYVAFGAVWNVDLGSILAYSTNCIFDVRI